MTDFITYLQQLLGREPSKIEQTVFACFNPEAEDKKKRFARYSESQSQFLNIDDEHYLYINNYADEKLCQLDMTTRHLETIAYYHHANGAIMLGINKPEKEKILAPRYTDYHIYIQAAAAKAAAQSLTSAAKNADHVAMIRDESPWERLCRVCVSTNTGGHITASHQRLFPVLESGLLYIVANHKNIAFKQVCDAFDDPPVFIGKTVAFPILSLDNEDGLLEIPLNTLEILQQTKREKSNNTAVFSSDHQDIPQFKEKPSYPEDIQTVLTFLRNEAQNTAPKAFNISENLPELYIYPFPLNGTSFSENGLRLHTLSSIVNLHIRGQQPVALTCFIETTAETPQDLGLMLTAINQSAKLFGVPVTNNCIVPGKTNRLQLFFITKDGALQIPQIFSQAGQFICLLGDPNGTLEGSAYAQAMGLNTCYSPAGVMTGTLVVLTDVIKECVKKGIIASATPIQRGGLITALHRACGAGFGVKIYSERKSSEHEFIFGEPQAAVLVSLDEKHLIDLARITSNYNLTSTTIGRVSENPTIKINNEINFHITDHHL